MQLKQQRQHCVLLRREAALPGAMRSSAWGCDQVLPTYAAELVASFQPADARDLKPQSVIGHTL